MTGGRLQDLNELGGPSRISNKDKNLQKSQFLEAVTNKRLKEYLPTSRIAKR